MNTSELTGGTIVAAVPLHTSNLLFLLGGGPSPLYPPNKVILWDDAAGTEVAELEFRERVRGIACRRGWLAVSLRRRVVVFQVGEQITRYGEWDTCDNPRGIVIPVTRPLHAYLIVYNYQAYLPSRLGRILLCLLSQVVKWATYSSCIFRPAHPLLRKAPLHRYPHGNPRHHP